MQVWSKGFLFSKRTMKEERTMKASEQMNDGPWASSPEPATQLMLNALDFSDLWDDEDLGLDSAEEDRTNCTTNTSTGCSQTQAPPPPPPPPPPSPGAPPLPASPGATPTKGCTLKLHWRELRSLLPLPKLTRFGRQTIWAGLEAVLLDTNRLEHLFETKRHGNVFKVAGGGQKQPMISVLGMKRSNIITIALSRLPPSRLLPPAIYSMDSSVLDREDLQRLQSLVPSEEELCLIREAQTLTPHALLAPAELCLLTLGEIPHLSSRLQLWAFALDYDILEREIAEALFHLKMAVEQLAASQTFKYILATVLAIGNFLNGCKARGFELSYLGKLSQVRDTQSRQPLLHHVCVLLLQLYPESSDLCSDIPSLTRASKYDYSCVQSDLARLEAVVKASWQQLQALERTDEKQRRGKGSRMRGRGAEEEVAASEGSALRRRLPKILRDSEERVKVLRAVHRRVINRFHSFLLFLGYSRPMVRETSAGAFCKSISDFSLEYRGMRQAILQYRDREREREAGRRETTAARTNRLQTPSEESVEQCRLEEVLRTPDPGDRLDLTLPRNRSRMAGKFSRKMKL